MPHVRVIFLLVALTSLPSLATSPSPSPSPDARRDLITLFPLVGVALDEGPRRSADEDLRAALGAVPLVEVLPLQDTIDTLDAIRRLREPCDPSNFECLAKVGALTAADVVVAGTVAQDEQALTLDLLAVDVGTMTLRARTTVHVPVGGGASALRGAAVALLRPTEFKGRLEVRARQRGASIYVDDLPRGFLPLAKPIELRPGPHDIFVGLEGFAAARQHVEIPFDETAVVDVELVPGILEGVPIFRAPPPNASAPPTTSTTSTTSTVAPPSGAEARRRSRVLRIAVYDVEVAGGEPRLARVLTQTTTAELRKLDKSSVMGADEIHALVADEESTSTTGCSADSCLADVAAALGADVLLLSQVTQLNGEYIYGVRRIDQDSQSVSGSFTIKVSSEDADALLTQVPIAIEKTFPDLALRPGMKRGIDEAARLALHPPPLQPWVFWVTTSSSAAFAASAAVACGVWLGAQGAYRDRVDQSSVDAAVAAQDLQVFSTTAVTGYVAMWSALGAAVAAGGAAAIVATQTDWSGDASR